MLKIIGFYCHKPNIIKVLTFGGLGGPNWNPQLKNKFNCNFVGQQMVNPGNSKLLKP